MERRSNVVRKSGALCLKTAERLINHILHIKREARGGGSCAAARRVGNLDRRRQFHRV